MYKLIVTGRFEKDLLKAQKRGLKIELIGDVLSMLEHGIELPVKYKNHKLKNMNPETWDLHIQPDWLLLYQINEAEKTITLVRTGTHSDIF